MLIGAGYGPAADMWSTACMVGHDNNNSNNHGDDDNVLIDAFKNLSALTCINKMVIN